MIFVVYFLKNLSNVTVTLVIMSSDAINKVTVTC